jgi:hypothetical protein
VNVCGSRNIWPCAEISTSSVLGDGDDEIETLGLLEADELTDVLGLSDMELETLTDGESEMLVLGLLLTLLLLLSLGDELMLTLTELLTESLTLTLTLLETESLTLTDGDELRDDEPIDATNTGPTMGAKSSVRACVRNGTPQAPAVCVLSALVEDEAEDEIDDETDEDADELTDVLGDELADDAISSKATSSIIGAELVQPVEVQVSAVSVATRVCTWMVIAAASFWLRRSNCSA